MTFHSYESPIKRVAVIGGGPSGVPAARHLREAGLEVVIYEHQSQVGGVWNYKEDASTLVVPSPPPVTGAFVPATFDNGITEMDTSTPCYLNLTNNVPTRTMGVSWNYVAGSCNSLKTSNFRRTPQTVSPTVNSHCIFNTTGSGSPSRVVRD